MDELNVGDISRAELKENTINSLIEMSGQFSQAATNILLKAIYYDNQNDIDKVELDFMRYLIELLNDCRSIRIDDLEKQVFELKHAA
jgi:hypothetical protein